jgi:hypothetical protein
MNMSRILTIVSTLLVLLAAAPALAQNQAAPRPEGTTFELQEVVDAGHQFFGQTSIGLASVIEYIFAERGRPVGYIVGEEASGAVIGGLRYGEGELRMKTGERLKVYWQGPTVGFDLGADGSRTMVLVYQMNFADQIFDIFTSTSGVVFVAGGLGVTYQSNGGNVVLAVIRTGIGLRLGVNLGYIKYTPNATWNPF